MLPSNPPDPSFDPSALSEQAPILSLVLFALLELLELRGETEVLECTPLPMDDRYAMHLESRGETGVAILLPRQLLERALLDSARRRAVRDLLHTAMQVFAARQTLGDRPMWLTTDERRTWAGPRCHHCEGPLLAEDPVVIAGVTWRHLTCPPG
jgi:hypothetical protein